MEVPMANPISIFFISPLLFKQSRRSGTPEYTRGAIPPGYKVIPPPCPFRVNIPPAYVKLIPRVCLESLDDLRGLVIRYKRATPGEIRNERE